MELNEVEIRISLFFSMIDVSLTVGYNLTQFDAKHRTVFLAIKTYIDNSCRSCIFFIQMHLGLRSFSIKFETFCFSIKQKSLESDSMHLTFRSSERFFLNFFCLSFYGDATS